MSSLTIKGIPEQLLERLRESAARHRRSLNGEVLYRLEHSINVRQIDVEEILTRIQARHARSPIPPLTDELLEKAIDEGRP